MADVEREEIYRVGKYQFELREDYEIALQEKRGVEYLDSQIDYRDLSKVASAYQELSSKRIFYTPVGLEYLNGLRNVIANSGKVDAENIPPLIVPSNRKKDNGRVEKYITRKYKSQLGDLSASVKKLKSTNRLLGMIVFSLVVAIIAMFIITARSDNPNILNYERVLQDKYASWAEDLEEKEEELRLKEKELQGGSGSEK